MKYTTLLAGLLLLLSACQEDVPKFERIPADQTGITFTNTITPTDSFNILKNEYMYNGGGVGVTDLNGDGLQDLIFTGNQVSSRVYLNQGDLRFQDITDRFVGLDSSQWYSGVNIADINGDGLPDVYLTSTTSVDPDMRKNRLWIHQGMQEDGLPLFAEQAEAYGVADTGYSVHSAFLDYDLDGDLDLYVLNNVLAIQVPTSYRPKLTDGSSVNNDQFYRNNGDGTFTNVTKEAGVTIEGYGLGLAVGDVNKDGYPDLYVSNDYISNDLLYLNQQDGTFRNAADEYLSYTSKFSMGNDISDVNNDGNPDVITLDMLPEKYSRKKQTINGFSYFFYVNDDKFGYQHQYVRNMLQLHNGFHQGEMLPYSEVGQLTGIFETEWSWSPLFADFDNDGDRDLLITNGFPKDLTDKDFTVFKAQAYNHTASEEQVLERIPVVKVPNYAYEQVEDLRFEKRSAEWGLEVPSFSNGASFVDLDNDGDLDYVVNNIDDPAFVYRNTSRGTDAPPAHYLRVQLKGSDANTQALGAKVEVWAGDRYQYQENYFVRGYISSVEPVLHFGLGATAQVDSIHVSWPGDSLASYRYEVAADQLLTISPEGAQPKPAPKAAGPALFARQPGVIPYQHEETDFVDFFQNQRTIPHKFSMVGPCMTQGDLNGDGLPDLLIGATDLIPTRIFAQSADGFTPLEIPGLTDSKVCAEADLLLLDVDGDGDNDLISMAGGYMNPQEEDYQHHMYLNQGDHFEARTLPIPPFPASVVKAFDFDHDGDQDLFVGARIKRNAFPLAGPSYLLRNDGGTFVAVPTEGFDLGMVTDATWADFDGDGWEDLMIAREWNSLVMLKNDGGAGFDRVEGDLSDKRGLWSAVTAVDLDSDGDQDLIAGNLGHNHRFHMSERYPLGLYALDIDNNGALDPFVTAWWADDAGQMQEYPVNYLDELVSQSPYFRRRLTTYTGFSQQPIHQIIPVDSAMRFTVNTTSSYVLWNDNGRFRWEALPRRLQTAPIREMLVRDFDGDGHQDVLIAGNDHSYDVATGLYNANKGYVLLGQGREDFEIVTPAESGLMIDGQVESIEYFAGDTSYLVVGINRGPLQVYRHQTAAAR